MKVVVFYFKKFDIYKNKIVKQIKQWLVMLYEKFIFYKKDLLKGVFI